MKYVGLIKSLGHFVTVGAFLLGVTLVILWALSYHYGGQHGALLFIFGTIVWGGYFWGMSLELLDHYDWIGKQGETSTDKWLSIGTEMWKLESRIQKLEKENENG